MKEKEERIKRMVVEGKVSEKEGKKLLDALKESEAKEALKASPPTEKGLEKKTSASAIASLVLGIATICLIPFQLFFIILGPISGILAVIFGCLGLRAIRRKELKGVGMAITGLVLGGISGFISLLVLLVLFRK